MRALFLVLALLVQLHAEEAELSKENKLLLTNAALGVAIAGWGLAQWDYGTASFHSGSEGWFESDTEEGGSDKLGHFYTNYLMTRILSPLYHSWGYTAEEAALYAGLTSALQSILVMEIGDGTSQMYGFSNEDTIMDILGALAGSVWEIYPQVASKIDFRVEFLPDFSQKTESDFTTDYENMKHLMALKGSGFEALQGSWAEYLEFHFGYYTRNFHHGATPVEERERYMYAAVGINLSHLLEPLMGRYATFFNYYQTPYTYLPLDRQLDP